MAAFNYKDPNQKGMLLIDDIELEPILDFNLYRDAISNIIRNSFPKFTIGIYGDWGTGKTTLMHSIERMLRNDKDLIRVRFETWRYEREEQFALVPLLKSISFALPSESPFLDLKKKLRRSAIDFFRKTPDILSSVVEHYLGEKAGKITEDTIKSFRAELNSKAELLAEVDRDTLYFDGFEQIKDEIQKIRMNNPGFRFVVFVDDLDRCSPKKTIEVLDSIKIFLGMEGFIYVIGMSHEVITKLIDTEFKESGVRGDLYIRKMIQIPISIPKWNKLDVVELTKDIIKKGFIHERFADTLNENIDLLSSVIEYNPREVKRFLNNFIVAHEIFSSNKDFKAKELFILQAIQLRWSNFYNILINSDENFRDELQKYILMDEDERAEKLDSLSSKDVKSSPRLSHMLRAFKQDSELWDFLSRNSYTLRNIKDWRIYRRATDIIIDPTLNISETDIEVLRLLKNGKIEEFNTRREDHNEFQHISLKNINLKDLDLASVNFQKGNLEGSFFSKIGFQDANLEGCNISSAYFIDCNMENINCKNAQLWGAHLEIVKMKRANLSSALLGYSYTSSADMSYASLIDSHVVDSYLLNVNLTGGDLRNANLNGAILVNVNFKDCNLSNVKLEESIIICPQDYKSMKLSDESKFRNAIIDDYNFTKLVIKSTRNRPRRIKNKVELNERLRTLMNRSSRTPLNSTAIKYLLKSSKLPRV